jgi:hypothetical protein
MCAEQQPATNRLDKMEPHLGEPYLLASGHCCARGSVPRYCHELPLCSGSPGGLALPHPYCAVVVHELRVQVKGVSHQPDCWATAWLHTGAAHGNVTGVLMAARQHQKMGELPFSVRAHTCNLAWLLAAGHAVCCTAPHQMARQHSALLLMGYPGSLPWAHAVPLVQMLRLVGQIRH